MGKRKVKVGIIGSYQSGKSLILNCILGDNFCEVGGGCETTSDIHLVLKSDFAEYYDTPGFGGRKLPTDKAPAKYNDKFDFGIMVCGGRVNKELDEDECKILKKIKFPFCLIYNTNVSLAENASIVISGIKGQLKNLGVKPVCVFGEAVFQINLFNIPKIKKFGANWKSLSTDSYSEKNSRIPLLREFLGLHNSRRAMTLKTFFQLY